MGATKLALVASLTLATPALAQAITAPTAAPSLAPAPIAVIDQTASPTILRTGTKIPLKMAEELTTKEKKLRVGQRFQLEVAENVRLGENVIIPVGTPATAEITDVRNKGMWGKSGKINAQLLYVLLNGRQIRMTGSFDDKGVTGTAGVIAAIALVPLAGFFTTGTSAKLPLGGAVTGFLDEDLPVTLAVAPAPALVVQPAAQPAVMTVAQPIATAPVVKSQ